jgi:hypothetical protein
MRLYEIRNDGAHLVRVPPRLWADGLTCNAFVSDKPANCLDGIAPTPRQSEQLTLMSGYEPLNYVVPGILARLGNDPFSADRLGRLGSAFVCLCFLTLAVVLLWGRDRGGLSLVGLVVALTPMAIFTAAVINPSGPEIMSSLAFLAALIRLSREVRPAVWVWVALAASGAALALSRSPGPAWVVVDSAAVALVIGGLGRAGSGGGREWRRNALLAASAIIVAAMGSMVWQALYGPPSSGGLRESLRNTRHAADIMAELFVGEIGMFGWLDSPMPSWAVLAWECLIVATLAVAVLVGSRRMRWGLVGTAIGVVVLSIAFAAWYRTVTGIHDPQGRHLLPIAVSIPLLAGEVIYRNADKLRKLDAGALLLPIALTAAVLQMVAWYWNAQRHSHGVNGSLNLFASPAWSPPLGWTIWVLIVAFGCLLLAASGVVRTQGDFALRRTRGRRSSDV